MDRISTVLFDLGHTISNLDHAFIAELISRHGHAVDHQQVARAEYRGKAAIAARLRARRVGTDASRQQPYFETVVATLGIPPAAWTAIADELTAANRHASLW